MPRAKRGWSFNGSAQCTVNSGQFAGADVAEIKLITVRYHCPLEKAMTMLTKKLDANQYNLKDQVVAINRVTKVVKGGKNMSFAALVVVGDAASGVVGYGSGKAKEVPQAIRKGIESAKKNLVRVNLTETTIPHQVLGRYGSGQVLLKPAPEGTGVIAGGAVRAVMTSVGVQNVLTKSIGSPNPHNVVKATFDALVQLRDRAEVATMRGKTVEEL